MKRKEFIKTCGFACLGGMTMTSLLQGCASANYFAQGSLVNDQLIVSKSEFFHTQKDGIIQRQFVLLESPKHAFPICMYKHDEDEYSALLTRCTHKGCELKPQGDYLVCPCHGSEFTSRGNVQHPPAEENLQSFKIATDNENIYIQL